MQAALSPFLNPPPFVNPSPRMKSLFTGQFADMKRRDLFAFMQKCGFTHVEVACWGDHFNIFEATGKNGEAYIAQFFADLAEFGLKCHAISMHLVGQAVCDEIGPQHQPILPKEIWGDGNPTEIRKRAIEALKTAATAAKKIGVKVVTGFTGSSVWKLIYNFPPVKTSQIEAGFELFGELFIPILDYFEAEGVRFALEVHPTEIAFDIVTAHRALEAVKHHKAFGFNYDPSHFGYQGVDYIRFLYEFKDRIFHVHMKDVTWGDSTGRAGILGGYVPFHTEDRPWDFVSLGRGKIDFNRIIRALNDIGYFWVLSIEWEDGFMDRTRGVWEALQYLCYIDFPPSKEKFDGQFEAASK